MPRTHDDFLVGGPARQSGRQRRADALLRVRSGRFRAARGAMLSLMLTGGAAVLAEEAKTNQPAAPIAAATDGSTVPAPGGAAATADSGAPFSPRPVQSWLEAQIALARMGFSCGSIDGVAGAQSAAALRAFQRRQGVRETGWLDRATAAELVLTQPALQTIVLPVEEYARFQPVSATWLGKSQQTTLGYESALEWAAEQSHANPKLIRRLNPAVEWDHLLPGARFTVPNVGRVLLAQQAANLHIRLADHVLEAFNPQGDIVAHFPVSIARRVEKRPEGELHVTVVIVNPDYTFDPDIFPESAEGREIGRKLWIPPGPNNPVGLAWIGLDRPGYGIHGTPLPESVGRTESHGCFRLANWDALTLSEIVWVGLPVVVDP